MNDIVLILIDCSLQRRLKPIQNLLLVIFTVSWLFIFILIFFNGNWVSVLFYIFNLLSIVSIIIFIIISFCFLSRKKVGMIIINEKKLIINDNEVYNNDDWYFDLNISITEENFSIEKLPFWGNYIVHKNSNKRIEFEPNIKLKKAIGYLEVKNSKRSVLETKTTDLFNNLMSLLWAAS